MSADAYKLRLDRPLDREIARLFRSQVNRARHALKTPDDEGVHTARKAIKRARAALRLARGPLPADRYRTLDHTVRGIGRRLAPVRDAAVALGLVDLLKAEGDLKASVAKRLYGYLDAERASAWRTLEGDGGIAVLRDELDALRLAKGELHGVDALGLHDGLARTYVRGRERLAQSVERSHAEVLHAWRRQVKHLGYQLRLLTPVWGPVLRATAREFDALSDALGDDHDLAELARLARHADLDEKALRAVQRLTRTRRRALQTVIWPLGARLYAEEAGAFAGRLIVYLAAALAEERDAPVHPLDGMALPNPPNRPLRLHTTFP